MDESKGLQRQHNGTTADKLDRWRFLNPDEAASFFDAPAMDELRTGHALLTPEQFKIALAHGDLEVLLLPHHGAALVMFGECTEGKALNILTATGKLEHGNAGLRAIEAAAKARGARVVMSVGRAGWKHIAQFRGYTVEPCILMKKVLHD